MAKREGMYFYRDWIESFELLSDAERGRLVLAMMKYAMEKEQPPQLLGLFNRVLFRSQSGIRGIGSLRNGG